MTVVYNKPILHCILNYILIDCLCYLEREKTSVGADIGQKFSNLVSVDEDDREGHEDWSATSEQKVDDKSDSVFLVHVLGS